MVNQEFSEILKMGVDAWNNWRMNNPDVTPAVEGDFSEMNLSGINFSRCSLSSVNFRETDLQKANFSFARLMNTDFTAADLSYANLSRASMHGPHMVPGLGTIFLRTKLTNTDFSEAECGDTIFADVDLSTAIGLETIGHYRHSSVDIDTIFGSRGLIPRTFLRGVGFPEQLLTYLPSLIASTDALLFRSCFISYSHKDEGFAKYLYTKLIEKRVKVWFAPKDMKAGQKMVDQIDRAIQSHEKLIIVLSEHSLKSSWVKTELRKARKKEVESGTQCLFPIRLMDFEQLKTWESFYHDLGEDLAEEIRSYYIPDFSNWNDTSKFDENLNALVASLRAANTADFKTYSEGFLVHDSNEQPRQLYPPSIP